MTTLKTSTQPPPKCGLIMPISAIDGCDERHWESVREVIKEALSGTAFHVELVSDSNESGIIQKRIVQNIYDNEMIICDVSAKNPNVMFELGMRLAFDKPTIIIKDDKTGYSFDTGQIEHIEYPRLMNYHAIIAFKRKLREKVEATYAASMQSKYTTFLKHFGTFSVAKLEKSEVSKDEYLMEAFKELREEVSSLRTIIEKHTPKSDQIQPKQISSVEQWAEIGKALGEFSRISRTNGNKGPLGLPTQKG